MTYLAYTVLAIFSVPLILHLALGLRTMKWSLVIPLYVRSTLLFLAGIPVTVLGWFVVALALPFRTSRPETAKRFTQYPDNGMHEMVNLPSWAWPWDNAADGMLGDGRGWWDNYCREHYGKDCRAFRSMWQWAAVRNPANNWSKFTTGVDQLRCIVERIAGGDSWQFLRAEHKNGGTYCLFEGKVKYPFANRAFYWRFGWKLELGEALTEDSPIEDRVKGSVYKFSPWKAM